MDDIEAVEGKDEGLREPTAGAAFPAMETTAPALSHRMRHDKSILAIVVSNEHVFAGTEGGEILVCIASVVGGAC